MMDGWIWVSERWRNLTIGDDVVVREGRRGIWKATASDCRVGESFMLRRVGEAFSIRLEINLYFSL